MLSVFASPGNGDRFRPVVYTAYTHTYTPSTQAAIPQPLTLHIPRTHTNANIFWLLTVEDLTVAAVLKLETHINQPPRAHISIDHGDQFPVYLLMFNRA